MRYLFKDIITGGQIYNLEPSSGPLSENMNAAQKLFDSTYPLAANNPEIY